MANYKNKVFSQETRILQAIADPTRVRALLALRDGELCVCQLIALLRLAPSTVSKHLSILKGAGLVAARKEGRWIYYRLADAVAGGAPAAASVTLSYLAQLLGDTEQVVSDRHALTQLLRMSLEEVCRIALPRSGCCSSARKTLAAAGWPKTRSLTEILAEGEDEPLAPWTHEARKGA